MQSTFIMPIVLTSAFLMAMTGGCATYSVKTECEKLKGVEYYPPKPYLVITKKTVVKDNAEIPTEYSVAVFYLPDYKAGKRFFDIRPNLGSASAELKLDDGWRLAGANITLDSKFVEGLNAGAGLLGAIPAGGAGAPSPWLEIAKMLIPGLTKGFVPAQPEKQAVWIFEIEEDGTFKEVSLPGFPLH